MFYRSIYPAAPPSLFFTGKKMFLPKCLFTSRTDYGVNQIYNTYEVNKKCFTLSLVNMFLPLTTFQGKNVFILYESNRAVTSIEISHWQKFNTGGKTERWNKFMSICDITFLLGNSVALQPALQ